MSTPNSRCRVLAAGLIAVWIGNPGTALAHADIIERIMALNREIQESSPSAALYLKRGELHRLHRDWPAALADYQRARRIAPDNPNVNYYMGRMRLESGWPDLARSALNRFLAVRPNHADALLIRSRALAQLGKPHPAAADLTKAIALLDRPTPEVYLERAKMQATVGPDYVDEALAGLDEGIARLGPLVTLIQYAVSMEVARGQYDAALARIEALPVGVQSGPAWLARRGDILVEAGRLNEARVTYIVAKQAILDLPPARRQSRAMAALEAHLRGALGRLNARGHGEISPNGAAP